MHRRQELNEKRLNNVKRPMCIIYLSMTMISEIWPTADCHIVCRMRGGSGVSHEERQGRQLVECSTGRRVTSRFDGLAGLQRPFQSSSWTHLALGPQDRLQNSPTFLEFGGIFANFRTLLKVKYPQSNLKFLAVSLAVVYCFKTRKILQQLLIIALLLNFVSKENILFLL